MQGIFVWRGRFCKDFLDDESWCCDSEVCCSNQRYTGNQPVQSLKLRDGQYVGCGHYVSRSNILLMDLVGFVQTSQSSAEIKHMADATTRLIVLSTSWNTALSLPGPAHSVKSVSWSRV